MEFKKANPPRNEDAPVYNRTVVWDKAKLDDEEKKVFLGKVVEGTLKEVRNDVGPNKSHVYVIETEDEVVQVWGSTVLDDQLLNGNDGEAVPLGSVVRITNLGKPAGKQYYNFLVEIALVDAKSALNKKTKAPAKKAAPVEADPEAEESEETEETEDGEVAEEGDGEDSENDFS